MSSCWFSHFPRGRKVVEQNAGRGERCGNNSCLTLNQSRLHLRVPAQAIYACTEDPLHHMTVAKKEKIHNQVLLEECPISSDFLPLKVNLQTRKDEEEGVRAHNLCHTALLPLSSSSGQRHPMRPRSSCRRPTQWASSEVGRPE